MCIMTKLYKKDYANIDSITRGKMINDYTCGNGGRTIANDYEATEHLVDMIIESWNKADRTYYTLKNATCVLYEHQSAFHKAKLAGDHDAMITIKAVWDQDLAHKIWVNSRATI